MGDDWEDWEASEPPPLPSVSKAPIAETKGAALLAAVNEPDMSKFADEDQGEEEDQNKHFIKPAARKKPEKEAKPATIVDQPLDDPVEERLRQQRLQEEADFQSAQELFGGVAKSLDATLPKSAKDFEEFASTLVGRYVAIHKDSKQYKHYLKALFKEALDTLPVADIRDIEASVASFRTEKSKAEAAAAQAKKDKAKKSTLNVGKSGVSAGLDDYVYDAHDDDYDFM